MGAAATPQTIRGAAAGFLQAQGKWAAAGMPLADSDLVKHRKAKCLACDQWDPGMWLGVGGCKACWCVGRLKWRQATSKCPTGKW